MRTLPSALLFAVAAITGCDGSDASPSTFVGVWRFDAGSMRSFVCDGTNADLTGFELELVEGMAADLQLVRGVIGGTDCGPTFSIEGDTAAIDPGQACHIGLVGSGCPVVSGQITQDPFTLQLDAGDTKLIVNIEWAGLIGNNGCSAHQCSGRVWGTTSKVN